MGLYIAWTRYQRRAESMKDYFGYQIVYMREGRRTHWGQLALSYAVRSARMLKLVVQQKPEVLWIQVPPSFLVHVAILAKLIMPRRMRLIADLHNAALLPLWMGVPGTMALLKQFDVILVHNKDVHGFALEAGITRDRLLVLEDRVPDFALKNSPRSTGRPALVMPCSFSPDEPIELVLDVARSLPDVDFIFTGDLQRIKRFRHSKELPENAVFTGFLEIDEFNDAILSSQGVLGLTTRDGIQLSAASEALGAGKPMILSDTPLLRSLFGPAALFTENSFEPLRAACLQAINHHAAHESATIALRSAPERLGRWLAQAESVKAILRA